MQTRELVSQAIAILAPLILAFIAYLVAVGVKALQARMPIAAAQQLLTLVGTNAELVVAELYQAVVADLKDPAKPGVWTEVAARAAKAEALVRLRAIASDAIAGLVALGRSPGQIDAILSAAVERAVVQLKGTLGQGDPTPVPASLPATSGNPATPVSAGGVS